MSMKSPDCERMISSALKWMTTIMVVLSILAIILTLFQKAFPCNISLTADGVDYFLSFFKPFYPLFSGTIVLITIVVALATYLRSKKIDAIKGLVDLRQMLMEKDNMRIHDLLEWDTQEERAEKENALINEFDTRQGTLYNYLGILELSNIYLENEIITETDFKEQFGYRIENAFESPYVNEKIFRYGPYWKNLIALYNKYYVNKQK